MIVCDIKGDDKEKSYFLLLISLVGGLTIEWAKKYEINAKYTT